MKEKKKIETYGNQSPGYVKGDFIINQNIINQHIEAKRKNWRKLAEIEYYAIVDNKFRRLAFASQLAIHLHRAFKEVGNKRFTSFISVNEKKIPGIKETEGLQSDSIPTYCLLTQQAKLCGELRKTWKTLWNPKILKADRQEYQDKLNSEITKFNENWSIRLQLPLERRINTCQFVYDPDSRVVAISPSPILSTIPSEYPNKIRTTSELFSFLFSVSQSPFCYTGDIGWINSSYPLYKLTLELMDKNSWMPGNIRINSDDPEDWDYINTKADEELRNYDI